MPEVIPMENFFPIDGFAALCHDLPRMSPWLPEETTYDGFRRMIEEMSK